MNLKQALASQTQRCLWAITQARGLNPGRSPTKADLAALILADLERPGALQADLAALSPAERQALDLLLAAPQPLSLGKLAFAFGRVRPYKPWRDDSPPHPWLDPSPLERLLYLGLAYQTHVPAQDWGQEDALFLPDDLRARLPHPPSPAQQALLPAQRSRPQEALASSSPLPTSDLLHDCFTFLSFLHCHDLTPRHRRWLTPRQFRPLNDRFGRPEPLHRHGKPILGEKRTARLRFIHFLLEAADLLALAGDYLKPTPAALTWLEAPPFQRLRSLWRVWGDPQTARSLLWHAFDLPHLPFPQYRFPEPARYTSDSGDTWEVIEIGDRPARDRVALKPLAALHRLLDRLRECRPGQLYDLDLFISAIPSQDLDLFLQTPGLGYRPEPYDDRRPAPDFVRELLTRHLRWFGLLDLHGDRRAPSAFSLTAAGAALLGLIDPPPEPPAQPPHLHLSAVDLSVDAAPDCPPALLYRLEPWVEWLGVRRYRLLPASLHRALQRGGCLDDLFQVLAEGCGPQRLSPDIIETLRGWAAAGRTLILRQPILLQAHSRELLDELAAQPTLRRHFRETLSPRHIVLDARDLEGLVRKLRQRGHHPHLTFPLPLADDSAIHPPPRDRDRPDGAHPWGPGGAAHLLLAARVFNGLARLIRPTAAIPSTVLDALLVQLTDRQRETVEQLAGETLERLVAAQDGWTPHACTERSERGPYHDALPVEKSRALIEQAIEGSQSLALDYWTAGREELTHRTVDPLRIEERRGIPYLVAHCHLRHAERVFRLDRIRSARVQAGEAPEASEFPGDPL